MTKTDFLLVQGDRRPGSARLGQSSAALDYLDTCGLSRIRAIARLLVLLIASGCVHSNADKASGVPEALRVPPDLVLIRDVRAVGVQIYECQASKDGPTGFRWTFKAPEAELRDQAGVIVGRHYAGPTWEANDGSKVVGEVLARDNGPDPNAIPWLLLSVKSTSGSGFFSHTKSVQRINTSGGNAPLGGCNEALAGNEARVAYKAEYLFYGSRP